MRRFIHKLRQKPKSTRQKIAFGTSASITSVIFAVWLTVMLAGGGVSTTTGSEVSQGQAASPLSAFKDNATSAFTEARKQLTSDATSSTTTTSSSSKSLEQQSTRNYDTQTVENQPYWKANDRQEQNSEDTTPPSSQSDNGFWDNNSSN